jgi:flagellar hook-basal body complex protein FliE
MANPYLVSIELAMASNHAAVLGALSRHLLGIHQQVGTLHSGFTRLGTAITGAIGVFAGAKLLEGMVHLVEKTKELSHEWVQIEKLGINAADQARVRAEAIRMTRLVPGTTEVDAMKVIGQLYEPLGIKHALEIAPRMAMLENVMKNTTGKWGDSDNKQMYEMVRSAEIGGLLTDPKTGDINMEKFKKYLDIGAAAITTTHGQITPKTWLNMMQQGGPAMMDLDPNGLRTMAQMAQMMGGHRVGTASMSLFQQMAGGVMPKRTARGMASIGLLHEGEWTSSGGGGAGGGVILTDAAKKRLTALIRNDPLEFAKKLKELMEAKGITDPKDQLAKLFDILGRATTQRFEADLLRNMAQIEGARQRQAGALPLEEAMAAQNRGDVQQNMKNLSAAWTELQYAIAGPNAENTIRVLQAMTGAIHYFEDVVRGMKPETLRLVTAGIAGFGLALMGGGAAAIIAAMGPAGWLIGGILGLAAALAILTKQGAFDNFGAKMDAATTDFAAKMARATTSYSFEMEKATAAMTAKITGAIGSLADGIMAAFNKIIGWLRALNPFGGGASPTMPGLNLPIPGTPGGALPHDLTLPTPSWPSLSPRGAPLPAPGGIPMNFRPDDPSGGRIENAILSIAQSAGAGGQPIQVQQAPININIDGRKIAESISAALATLMEFPNQAPYHDSFGGYAPPDHQQVTT